MSSWGGGDVADPLSPALVTLLASVIDKSQPAWKREQKGLVERLHNEVPRAIADHHVFVAQWCQEIHARAFGPRADEVPTAELTFNPVQRRLGVGGREIDELDVLLGDSNVAVLGDLGAGKTTTFRKLASYVALGPPVASEDDWEGVILVVCRNEHWDRTGLYDVLGRIVGITGKLREDIDNSESRIREVLDTGFLILIDGLDEVPPRYRSNLDGDIAQLGQHLANSKIIVSCRSADYVRQLEGFDVAEIQPLRSDQRTALVRGLLDEDDVVAFESAIEGHPVSDLADRPLFLNHLALIYKLQGTIPERPTEVYDAIVRLSIREWDEERGVIRTSQWSGFGVGQKQRFLADLAHVLIRRGMFQFGHQDLIAIYDSLADRYQLPKSEARTVARELESHTGLLAEVGGGFEFSHAALQEYLAADAMVRGPDGIMRDWWEIFPAVAAVTVALSSDPNERLRGLVELLPLNMHETRPLQVFLDRLGQERPRFVRSKQLGEDLVKVVSKAHIESVSVVDRLGSADAIRDSVADYLHTFTNMEIGPTTTKMARYEGRQSSPKGAVWMNTAVAEVLVGKERLHQVERDVSSNG